MKVELPHDPELAQLRALFEEIQQEHLELHRRHERVSVIEHERHRDRLRSLIEAIHNWREKHL